MNFKTYNITRFHRAGVKCGSYHKTVILTLRRMDFTYNCARVGGAHLAGNGSPDGRIPVYTLSHAWL